MHATTTITNSIPTLINHTTNVLPPLVNQPSVGYNPTIITNPLTQYLPPVPSRIRERIIKGEFIDFVTLLPKAMFSTNHYPDHCPFRSNPAQQISGRQGSANRGQPNTRVPTGGASAQPSTFPTSPSPQYCRDFNYSQCSVNDVGSSMAAINAEPVIRYGLAQSMGILVTPIKPQPWTPVRLFLLEHELSLHPDKIFVRQLINDLQHGCSIGYTGPQFAHSAKNLLSAYQQPSVIDAALHKECEAGRILGPF